MRHFAKLGVLAAVAVLVAGCATIVRGGNQTLAVSSNVDGADVLLDGEKIGVTPFTGSVKKNKGILTVQKAGYQTATISLNKSLEPMFWGNIITGGTLGSITDFATGSAFQYAPSAYQVDLKPEATVQKDFDRQVAARKFAMIYQSQIATDLAHGNGEYLGALLSIMQGKADAAAVRAALVASDADPVRFGNAIVGML